jgi:hypothetical protein
MIIPLKPGNRIPYKKPINNGISKRLTSHYDPISQLK